MKGQCSRLILQIVLIVFSLHILKASGSSGTVEFADDPPTCTTASNSGDRVFYMKATIKTTTNATISKFEYLQGQGLHYRVAVNNGSMTSNNGTHVIRFTVVLTGTLWTASKVVGCRYFVTGDDVIPDDVAQECDVTQYVNVTKVKCSTTKNVDGSQSGNSNQTGNVGHSDNGNTTDIGNNTENVSQLGNGSKAGNDKQTAKPSAPYFPLSTPDSTHHTCRLAVEKSDKWEPLMIAVIVHTFVTFTTIVLVYMYLVGKVERRRKTKPNKETKEKNKNKEIKVSNEIQENKEKSLVSDSDATAREKRHVAFDVPYVTSSEEAEDISSDMASNISSLSSTTVSSASDSESSGAGSTDTSVTVTTSG